LAENNIPVFVRILGDTKDLGKKLKDAERDVKSWVGNVESAGLRAGASFGIFGAALTAVGLSAIKTASGFEDMQTRLAAITRDGEKAAQVFNNAVALSASTPFPVGQVVQAATALTMFRQNVQATLPKVADFAAATGKDLPEAATLIGKALEGNAKGFRALSNQADISANDLRNFGAALDKNGKVALDNSVHIDQARAALSKLLSSNYGGAAAAQANTLSGSITKLQDNLSLAAAAFGKTLVPAATVAVQAVTGLVEHLQAVPDWLKAIAAAGTIGAGGLSIVGATAILAGSQVLGMAANLSALALRFPAIGAGIGTISAALSGALAPAIAVVGTALQVAAPYLLAFTALLVAGELALAAYRHGIQETDAAVTQQAKSLATASGTAQGFATLINQASGTDLVHLGKNLAETQDQVKKAFSSVPPEKMVAALEKAGLTLDGLKKKLEQNRDGAADAQKRYQTLAEAITKAEGADLRKGESDRVTVPENLKNLFGDENVASIADAKKQLEGLNAEVVRFGQGKIEIEAMSRAFENFQQPLVKATDEARELQSYLKFAEKAKDLETMTAVIRTLADETGKLSAAASQQGLPTDRAGLTNALLTAQGSRKEFIEEFIKKIDEQEAAQKRLDQYEIEGQKEIITELDRRREREVALSDPATTNKGKLAELADEKSFLDRKLALVAGANARELALEQQLRAAKGSVHEQEIRDKLKEVRPLSDDETKTLSKQRANKRETIQTQAKGAGQDFDNSFKDSVSGIKAQRDTSAVSARDTANAYSGVLQKLEAWKTAHKDLIAGSDELRDKVNNTTRQIKAEIVAAQQAVKADNLTKIKTGATETLAEEVDLRKKIVTVSETIATIEKAVRQDTVGRKEGLAEINALKKTGIELAKAEKEVEAKEKLTGVNEEKAALDQEIAILELRKQAGQNVEFTLGQLRKQRLQDAISAINLEYAAEVAAHGKRESLDRSRQAKIDTLLRDEYTKQLQQYNDQEKAAQDHEQKLDDIKNRVGGKHSPLQSMEEAFGKGGLGSDFDLGQFDVYKDHAFRAAPPTPQQVAAQLGLDTKGQAQAQKALGAAGTGAAPAITNVNLSLNFPIAPDEEAIIKKLGQRAAKEHQYKSLVSGTGAPPMTSNNLIWDGLA
jgi:hypothetical protein